MSVTSRAADVAGSLAAESHDGSGADDFPGQEVSIASAQPRASNGRFMRVVHASSQPDESGLPGDRFLDREISWLQFNERVLQLAADESVPLLERARFLAIFTSNLDEFFMVRVAGLKRRIATGLAVRSASGLEPREVLEQISPGRARAAGHAERGLQGQGPACPRGRGHLHRPLGRAQRLRARPADRAVRRPASSRC